MEAIEARHERELAELQLQIRDMLKKAKKSEKAVIEAQAVQMQFDLKAKHREEIEEFETNGYLSSGTADTATANRRPSNSDQELSTLQKEIDSAEKKREKARKKRDKKSQKEQERENMKSQILLSSSGVKSSREIEAETLLERLSVERLRIKDIPSDGHCLYRAISDQLQLLGVNPTYDFRQLRSLAAEHIRNNSTDFAPFLGLDPEDSAFQQYCDKVQSESFAEWGGQIEIRALSECLNRGILVYSADSPLLITGEYTADGEMQPIRLSYHRHLFALGEHYNSLIPAAEK